MMAGPGINQRRVFAPVEARDLARTVCKYLGIAPLSDATGQLLPDLVSAETD
jgi:hypothetical protein